MAALRGAISETVVGPGGQGQQAGDPYSHFTTKDCVDATGAFTQKFKEELQLIADEQLSRLEALGSRAAA